MIETPDTIAKWAADTFGVPTSDVRIYARASQEMAELQREVTGKNRADEVAEECADVAIILCRLAVRHNVPISLTGSLNETPVKQVADLMGLLDIRVLAAASAHSVGILDALIDNDPEAIARELRQAMLALGVICWKQGTTLERAVQAKMAVNRTRRWKLDGTGHGFHVREVA